MTKPTYDTKTFTFAVKALDDEQGLIEAYGSVFGNIDSGKDRVLPGAFKRTILHSTTRMQRGKKFLWPMLYQHDANLPIGGWYEAEEDARGLKVKGRLNLETQLGRETYSNIKMGIIDEFSIGYEVPTHGSAYDKAGTRDLKEIRLWEISPVTFAMNDQALLVGVKEKKMPQHTTPTQHKAFADEYQQNQIQDWLGGWYSLTSALKSAIMDAFDIGDQPMEDVMAALNGEGDDPGFIQALQDWTQQGMDLCVCDFMDAMEESDASSSYMMMSAFRRPQRKEGRSFSQSNLDMIGQHVQSLNTHADQLHEMAADLATNTGAQTYVDPSGKPDSADPKTASLSRARGLKHSDEPSTADLEDWKKQLRQARTLLTTTR